MSNDVTLTVDALPPVVLTLQAGWTNIVNTERAALHCDIQDRSPVWMHKWYRDGQELPVGTAEDTYEILSAVQSDSGTYTCQGQHKERVLYTGSSNTVALKVYARPQAVLTLETAWTEIFRSDSLTLRCQVEGSSVEWNYTWYRDGQHLPLDPSGDRLILSAGNDSYSSEYKCRGNRTGQPSYTEISEGFRANNIVENLARIAVGAAILLFLSVIVNEGFWRRARKMRRCCI
ncbi:putative high affinity immunoglobulin gamma Fc receptor IB [Anguilla rostrata]|uniref:putative high affinity immunoglobulin gamma Fc receptor IB n=1 Tax=Anguilla rostrata TaxID=7938 RepID=UPI0030CB1FBE